MEVAEKRLEEEKRNKTSLECQLAQEKKQREIQEMQLVELKKKLADVSKSKLTAVTTLGVNGGNQECCQTERCAKRLRDLEVENLKIGADLRKKQDRVLMLECELKSLSRARDTESRVDTLMNALNLMEDKNASLQESLSAETRFKLDLFSALGEARRQLESVNCKQKLISCSPLVVFF